MKEVDSIIQIYEDEFIIDIDRMFPGKHHQFKFEKTKFEIWIDGDSNLHVVTV